MSRSKTSTSTAVTIDAGLVRDLVPVREAGAHKWGVGGLLIVGGSPGYVGAPALAALAAGRSGAGIITIASPRSSLGAIASIVPEATFLPLPEGDLGVGGERAAARIQETLERYRALVVGPGLGKDEYANAIMQGLTGASIASVTSKLVGFSSTRTVEATVTPSERRQILGGDIAAVIDADALNWLAAQDEWSKRFASGTLVLTPHVGEMARLTGLDSESILADPASVAAKFASEWQQTVVLKGGASVVTNGDIVRVASSGPTALATAGSGDVLAGSIGAFLAQGLAPIDAASLAVYLGTYAAEALSVRLSPLGVVASDLPVAIAEAFISLR
jgi:NAD(P)H-hydrate epimerase